MQGTKLGFYLKTSDECVYKHYENFETMKNQIETSKYIPEKAKQIALARLDIVHK